MSLSQNILRTCDGFCARRLTKRTAVLAFGSVLVSVFTIGLAAGCSNTLPETRYYLLTSPELQSSFDDSQKLDSACSVQLGGASVAPYLQRTHIMLHSGANELVPAMQHRWSEPIEAGVNRLLERCLGGGQQASHRATVRIDHLHGDTAGMVVLQAHWSLDQPHAAERGVMPAEGEFHATVPQPVAGYDALVSTQRQLVLQLCAEIKASLPACS